MIGSTNSIDLLISAASAHAGSRDRGITDLCRVFGVQAKTLYVWRCHGIPVGKHDLAQQVAAHYGINLSPTVTP